MPDGVHEAWRSTGKGAAKQSKQTKAKQGKGRVRQFKAKAKPRHGKAEHSTAKQSRTKQSKTAKQSKSRAEQYNAKHSKAKQIRAKQSRKAQTKQSKNKARQKAKVKELAEEALQSQFFRPGNNPFCSETYLGTNDDFNFPGHPTKVHLDEIKWFSSLIGCV